ncbi:D-aminoacyl-tRNA deacylase [Hydrogenovibrio marinus]|uniref:D-aminoacyl-tRNA deacylase n=1 Tax=Hydrogenovibrio marinus TaxID=28885 RepID=A0A066ZR16_HYDMR|nr:D-aminoacyl-tRNA deacylase [Hydrogenovibrio marinus]KDN95962.1 D-tyrosyl-tRNA(Tyr) deacylase [Hydrogenovibrio marinus]BBN58545.1 D-aminoacyl-tRNA deacylase [Hydrogenovibrio marinus]
MICILQRVSEASVKVEGGVVGEIGQGLMVLCGFQPGDNAQSLEKMTSKLLKFRVFSDDEDKMNLNIQQINGQFLLVPQFTLAADTSKGNRPSFHTSAPPEMAQQLFEKFVALMNAAYQDCQTGVFGADMKVSLVNDGPVTFQLVT